LYKLNKAHWCLILALLPIFIIQAASAQDKVYLGIKAGGNLSKTTRSEYSFRNPARFGLNLNPELGMIAHIPLHDSISFQPEILLVRKGFKAYGVYNQANGKSNKKSYEQLENTHIEIPLLVKLAVGNQKIKFFFAAGPAISLLSNSYYKIDSTGSNVLRQKYKVAYKFRQTEPKVVDSTDVNGNKEFITAYFDSITVKSIPEISAVFATGFHYKLKNSMIIFDIRYVYGLRNPYRYLEDIRPISFENNISPVMQPARIEEFNRRFSFSISYLVSLNK